MDRAHRVIELTNHERAKRGLRSLTWNEQLFKAAQGHCVGMARGDYFDHRQFVDRVKEEGYPSPRIAENIAAGSSTPEQVVRNWMNSPGHRRNILTSDFTEIGVGHHYEANDGGRIQYKHYWTQIFGKR